MFYARSNLPANSWSFILRNMNTGQSAEKTGLSHNNWNLKLSWSNNWATNLALETRNAFFTFKNLLILSKVFHFSYPFKSMWWISGTQWNQRLFKISEVSLFHLREFSLVTSIRFCRLSQLFLLDSPKEWEKKMAWLYGYFYCALYTLKIYMKL